MNEQNEKRWINGEMDGGYMTSYQYMYIYLTMHKAEQKIFMLT